MKELLRAGIKNDSMKISKWCGFELHYNECKNLFWVLNGLFL